jgi:ATP-binding cassette subfamily B protein
VFKLLRQLKPFAAPIAAVLGLVFLQSLSDLYLPNLMSRIVDTGIVRGDTQYIMRVGGLMLLVALGGTLCAVMAGFLASRTATGFGKLLRGRVFSHVESFSAAEVNMIGTASLITRTTNDITQVQMLVVITLRMMISAPMMIIGGIIMAIQKEPTLSLVLVVALPLLAALILLVARRSVPLFRALQNKLDKLNLVVRENLTGVRVIRAFDRIDHEQRRFDAANRDLTETAIRVNRTMAVMMPAMILVLNYTVIAIIWFGGIRIDRGHMQVGDLMAFIQYAIQIMFSLMMASLMFVMIPRASASATRINEVLDVMPEIEDPVEARPAGRKRGVVEFKDVTFGYPGAEQPAINRVSFRTDPGQVTAIIGGTGWGNRRLSASFHASSTSAAAA